jgi:plasmid stabilization system protein ParE
MGPRRRRVAWSEGAHRELDEAIGYVARDSAARLLNRLLGAAESLAELSERGRTLPELGDPTRAKHGRPVHKGAKSTADCESRLQPCYLIARASRIPSPLDGDEP